MSVEFILPDLTISSILTGVSGQFFEGAVPPTLTGDISHQILVNAPKDQLNKIFLFFTDNTIDDPSANPDGLGEDLNDASFTDIKYAMHLAQWNPEVETTKSERKHVIDYLLQDIFGVSTTTGANLFNIDVFSNEDAMDADISDIFIKRMADQQRVNLAANSWHGTFTSNVDLSLVPAQDIIDASQNDTNNTAITKSLLEQASLFVRQSGNESSNAFRRQFDLSNNSNALYGLPPGWRTFQFVEGDLIKFRLVIDQLTSVDPSVNFYPQWSANTDAATGTAGTPTPYGITFVVRDTPVAPRAVFQIPPAGPPGL